MASTVEEDFSRERPAHNEAHYWQVALIKFLCYRPSFRSELQILRRLLEADEVTWAEAIESLPEEFQWTYAPPLRSHAVHWFDKHYRRSIQSDSSTPLPVHGGEIPWRFPPSVIATALRFGLSKDGKATRWAVDLIERAVAIGPDGLQPHMPRVTYFETFLHIRVDPDSGAVSIFDQLGEENRQQIASWSAPRPTGTQYQFGSREDWNLFREGAARMAMDAVDHVEQRFRKRYPSNVRRAKSRENWTLLAEQLAILLTGGGGVNPHPKQLHRFCDLIGIDTPPRQWPQ
jgi:hypothetical protein